MSRPLIRPLADIGKKPDTNRRDHLTITRRVVRALCERRQSIHAERRALRREAGKLREHLPFTQLAAERLEQQAREHRAEELSFEALADLLNINRVDRERARREGWTTLRDLIAIHDLENSADHRGAEPRSGSPLHQACQLALLEFIRTCPEHLLSDPFALGAPFGPKRPSRLRIVGK